MRVLVAGHLCLDFIPALDDDPGHDPGALYLIGPMQVRLGGAVHTTGAALAALGIDILLAGVVTGASIGGSDPSLRNVIGGATSYGVEIPVNALSNSSANTITNNLIGIAPNGLG